MSYKLIAPLHEYQKVSARHVLREKGNALFLEMGLGKTLTTLEILNHRKYKGKSKKTLIVAPRRICEQVWRQEVTQWGYPLSVTFLKGSPAKRLEMIKNDPADIHLLTYENLIWLEETGLFPYDSVVLDELSRMKNSGSKRWRAFKRILRKHSPWVLGLTGTPAPNGYDDLWAQMYCLDQGKTLGKAKGKFLTSFFTNISREPHKYAKWKLRPGAKSAIDSELKAGGVIAMTAKDVLGQQDPIRQPSIRLELTGRARSIYEELEGELMATMPDGTVVLPEHDAVVQMKLRQVASGFMLDENRVAHRLHDAKTKALFEAVEEMDGEPLMVVYTFQEELAMIREALGQVPYLGGGMGEREATRHIADWNNRELPVLCVQPQAAGHGLNLQRGGNHILFYGCDWNLETYQQVIARLNRQGQESTVFVRHMVAGDVEDRIIDDLAGKAGLQAGLMHALKD